MDAQAFQLLNDRLKRIEKKIDSLQSEEKKHSVFHAKLIGLVIGVSSTCALVIEYLFKILKS